MAAWLIPQLSDPVLAGQAALIMITCLGLAVVAWVLVIVWRISGDLERLTLVMALILSVVLLGVAWVARSGAVTLAALALIGLLVALISFDTYRYGPGMIGNAAHLIPIALAACTLGLAGSLSVAAIGAAVMWGIAIAVARGRYRPLVPFERNQLTFNAPTLTVIYFLVALIAGWWSEYLLQLLRRP